MSAQMKKSLYNHIDYIDESWVLYNVYTDELCLLDEQVKTLYVDKTLEEIKAIHPDFYAFLKEKQFIVPSDTDEAKKCIEQWTKADEDKSVFTLTVNPTLDCNMRCWYCYEKHQATRTMSTEMLERVYKFIENKLNDAYLTKFNLTFFGGEPLLQYSSIVKPLIAFTHQLSNEKNIELEVGFTTNGYLLSPEILSYLASLKVPIHFQITLDGNQRMHGKTRHLQSGAGSYEQILDNCSKALQNSNIAISLRCNYTTKNVATFMDLADDLKANDISKDQNILVTFHRVWQDYGNDDEVALYLDKAYQSLVNKGYKVSDIHAQEKYRCYAERDNHVVINYDGNLFHCTARDFVPENAEGELTEDGTLVFNEKSKRRNRLKWGTEACMNCSIYPLCNGLCSQKKVEYTGLKGCIAGYTNKAKNEIIHKRILSIINERKANNN